MPSSSMWLFLQIALAWIVLSIAVAIVVTLFFDAAHRRERQLPRTPAALGSWVGSQTRGVRARVRKRGHRGPRPVATQSRHVSAVGSRGGGSQP
jgi:hypothetical protein